MAEAAKLEAEYCPPIDTALFSAIVSDFDLSTEDGVTAARETLGPLKESAAIEEAAGFDPSGVGSTGAQEAHQSADKSSSRSQSLFDSEYHSVETDESSLSTRFAHLNVYDDEIHDTEGIDLENLDKDTKVALLHDVFQGSLDDETISSALHRSNDQWNSAMEDLLNQVYIIEDRQNSAHQPSKSVDGFAADEDGSFRRVQKRKKARAKKSLPLTALQHDSAGYSTVNSAPSRWDEAQTNVEFLAKHLHVNLSKAKSAYNEHNSSMPQTINALLKEHMQRHPTHSAELWAREGAEGMGQKYPTIALPYRIAILQMTKASVPDACQVATALITPPRPKAGGLTIIPQYSSPVDGLVQGSTHGSKKVATNASGALASELSSDQTHLYAARRTVAFAQARAAHQRAKSDRHMGGAASYYAQLGHEYSGLAHAANAASADELAYAQSSANQVDLHGIDVLNAVRIAQEKVEFWWSSTAEIRATGRQGAAERGNGYRIVVGRGTHSEGGKGKLGPAVSKMLRAQGWRFENEGAAIVVRGKQRA